MSRAAEATRPAPAPGVVGSRGAGAASADLWPRAGWGCWPARCSLGGQSGVGSGLWSADAGPVFRYRSALADESPEVTSGKQHGATVYLSLPPHPQEYTKLERLRPVSISPIRLRYTDTHAVWVCMCSVSTTLEVPPACWVRGYCGSSYFQ